MNGEVPPRSMVSVARSLLIYKDPQNGATVFDNWFVAGTLPLPLKHKKWYPASTPLKMTSLQQNHHTQKKSAWIASRLLSHKNSVAQRTWN